MAVLVHIHREQDHVHAVNVLEEDQALALGGELVRVVLEREGGREGGREGCMRCGEQDHVHPVNVLEHSRHLLLAENPFGLSWRGREGGREGRVVSKMTRREGSHQ